MIKLAEARAALTTPRPLKPAMSEMAYGAETMVTVNVTGISGALKSMTSLTSFVGTVGTGTSSAL